MSTLTISSPGVQINEVDLSQISNISGQTNVFLTGFSPKGPTNKVINVTTLSDFENTFGTPTNSAERYLYQSAKQLLNASPANVLVTRMPYGSGAGAGYSNQYTALAYPISANGSTYENSTAFNILTPTSVLLTDDQYTQLIENNVTWSTTPNSNGTAINSFPDIANNAGLVVIDIAKTSVNDLYEGYYIGLCDNSNVNPATDFNAITGIQASSVINNGVNQTFTLVPSSRLSFSLTQSFSAGGTSISQIIEQYPTSYNFGSTYYNDCLTVMVFKIKSSIYGQNTVVLNSTVDSGFTGSLYSGRTQNNPLGGTPVSFNLETVTNTTSQNIRVAVNPNISQKGTWINSNGSAAKTVRVDNGAKNLYSEGVYTTKSTQINSDIGNVPLKLQNILQLVDTLDISLDVTCEAGLGTIWVGANSNQVGTASIFDENLYVDISSLKSQTGTIVGGTAYTAYQNVANQFITFAEKTKRDHIFIADPLRYIFVQGSNTKTSSVNGYNFSKDIYWPLQNLYAANTTSYAAVYGNWLSVNDAWSNKNVWIPPSAWVAGIIASSSQAGNPWDAPAGFNRGAIFGASDVAVTPTQKQRDLLYKININPIATWPGEGIVVFGQKTLYTYPSAFDRINVRRLFLVLEKATRKALRHYVFEPNNYVTQTRLKNTLTPIFNKALNSNGLYAYEIVCDGRNNPPAIIDNNQLNVAIYIQPVRTAEFILCDFIATQTGINFNEIISQGTF